MINEHFSQNNFTDGNGTNSIESAYSGERLNIISSNNNAPKIRFKYYF